MEFEWDEAKRLGNLKKHGVDFADVGEFDWIGAQYWDDRNADYGEERCKAAAQYRGRIHVVLYTMRGTTTRIISFRLADKREVKQYEKEKDQPR